MKKKTSKAAPAPVEAKRMIIFHIGVGHLPPDKADAFIEKQKNKMKEQLRPGPDNLPYSPVFPKNTMVMWLPFRGDGNNYIEVVDLS